MAGKANYLVRAKNGAVFVTSTLAEAKKVEASGTAPAKRRRNPAKRGSAKRRNPSAAEHKKRGAKHLQDSMDFLVDFVPKLRRLQEQAGPKSGLYKPELRRAYSSALEAAALANQDFADAGMGYTGDRSLAISALQDARDGLIANPKAKRGSAKRRSNPAKSERGVQAAVVRAKQEIAQDQLDGIVPVGVHSFADLHDYVDANTYGGMADPDGPLSHLSGGAFIAAANKVIDQLDKWLKKKHNPAKRGSAKRRRNPADLPVVVELVDDDGETERFVLIGYAPSKVEAAKLASTIGWELFSDHDVTRARGVPVFGEWQAAAFTVQIPRDADARKLDAVAGKAEDAWFAARPNDPIFGAKAKNPAKRRRNPSASTHLKLAQQSLASAQKALKIYPAADLNDHGRQTVALHALRQAEIAHREFNHAGGSAAGYAGELLQCALAAGEAESLLSKHLKHNPAKRRRNPAKRRRK